MNEYTVEYFIKKFENISDNNWCIDVCLNDKGQYCALGHCGARSGTPTKESTELNNLFLKALGCVVPNVNDGRNLKYQQSTPKQRILAALNFIKEQK